MDSRQDVITIYTDGGSRGNPGKAAYGYVIYREKKKLHQEGKCLGIQTNNYAEYMAVIKALEWLKDSKLTSEEVNLYSDSLLVSSQLTGRYKVKHPVIKQLFKKVKGIESFFAKITYSYIPREKNTRADRLVNEALDRIS